MKITDLLNEYLEGKTSAVETIRMLSGIFNPDTAVDLLTLINAVTRVELGDLDKDTFRSVWKVMT